MYAIARIAGKQFRIEIDQKVKVPKLPLDVGAAYEISDVLLTAEGEAAKVGLPLVEGITAHATVVEHGREDKIIVHRKKRRKGFTVTNGHRQQYTVIRIDAIGATAADKPKAKRVKKEKAPAGEGE
jgi:large subunit ribosomal protein L21